MIVLVIFEIQSRVVYPLQCYLQTHFGLTDDNDERKKWDFLEGPKGRYGWGHHPYTLLTAIFYVIKTQVEWILFHIQKDNLT